MKKLKLEKGKISRWKGDTEGITPAELAEARCFVEAQWEAVERDGSITIKLPRVVLRKMRRLARRWTRLHPAGLCAPEALVRVFLKHQVDKELGKKREGSRNGKRQAKLDKLNQRP